MGLFHRHGFFSIANEKSLSAHVSSPNVGVVWSFDFYHRSNRIDKRAYSTSQVAIGHDRLICAAYPKRGPVGSAIKHILSKTVSSLQNNFFSHTFDCRPYAGITQKQTKRNKLPEHAVTSIDFHNYLRY